MLRERDEQLCSGSRWDFSDLRAFFINCTLKRSPEVSHTQGLPDHSIAIMRKQGSASTASARSTTRSPPACGRT